jgi:competence protein ComEC
MKLYPSQLLRFCLLALIVSVGVYSFIPAPSAPLFHNGEFLNFSGLVVSEADARINHVKLTIKPAQEYQTVFQNKVLVSTGLYPEYSYGDHLSFSCRVRSPEAFDGFAYDRYLAKQGIYALCLFPRVTYIDSGYGNTVMRHLLAIKNTLRRTIYANLHEPQASLLTALLLGSRGTIPPELRQHFSLTGMSHIIAISGMHIILLITLLQQLLIRIGFWRQQAFWIVSLLIIGYLGIIGFPASAVRASIMGWLLLLSAQLGRPSNGTNALLLAAAIMLTINPKLLRDDIGFQLSFAATLGIQQFGKKIEPALKWLPETLGLRSTLQMSLAAQFTTLPLVVWHFGTISFIGPLSNILFVPLLPYLMIAGGLGLILSLLLPAFGLFWMWPTSFLLSLLTESITLLSRLPGSAVQL